MKKVYVLDTSVCLTDADCLTSFENNDIVVPLKVLEEIDHNKKRQDGAGINARKTIRMLDSYREKGSLHKGVRIAKGKGIIQVKGYDVDVLPKEYDANTPDNQIIATALTERTLHKRRKVIVVSRDINMRVKCDSIGLLSEDYIEGQVVKDMSYVYTGTTSHLVDEQVIDKFYSREDVMLEEDEIKLYPNQFVMLVSNSNEKKTALARFVNYSTPLQRIPQKKDGIWGVHAKNKEQAFALDLLMNPDIDIITLVGKAGSGKTLCAIAAALEQTMEGDNIYKRVIVSRPIQPMGKDIGYLPGTMEEKMNPWLAPIEDNLRFLMGNDKEALQMYMDSGTIEIEALTYIRGRSIANAFIIIDEAQNLTIHELKTIVTRVGEGTKIVLTGDIEQIDNVYTDETSNGLTHAVEKFKDYELAGHIILQKGERSKVATLAAKVL